tara:strand:- start:179 stop:565 length:387 start_codon:yes stop_codon:yes gene_type:complete
MDRFKEIIKTACLVNNLTIDELKSKSRLRHIVDSRRMVFSVARDLLKMSYKKIGSVFNMNHATIIHHVKQHNCLMVADFYYKDRFNKLLELYKLNISYLNQDELIEEIKELKAENLRIESELIQKNNE